MQKRVRNFQSQPESPDQDGIWGPRPRAERVCFRWADGYQLRSRGNPKVRKEDWRGLKR